VETWIYQGNPDEFDLDGQVPWLVTRYAAEIAVGDPVYLWRNQGTQCAIAGVVAQGIVIAAPAMRVPPRAFSGELRPCVSVPQMRATMRLVKVSSSREVNRRDWCVEAPILRDLPTLQMQAGTNYRIGSDEAPRLDALWSRTGRDWTRNGPSQAYGPMRRPTALSLQTSRRARLARRSRTRQSRNRCVCEGDEFPLA
jgi:hypothetical protein